MTSCKKTIYVSLILSTLLVILLFVNWEDLGKIDSEWETDKYIEKYYNENYQEEKYNEVDRQKNYDNEKNYDTSGENQRNTNLDYLQYINPKPNRTENLTAVLLVTSYFGNVETRSAMRRAFSNQQLLELGLQRVFLLGTTTKDRYTSQKQIDNEKIRFGDILQGNFTEAYRNLTIKHLMGLRWASESSATFIIKMDDDIVVDLRGILELLNEENQLKNKKGKLLAGYVIRRSEPKREPANKWFVTFKEFKWKTYPDFLSGWFYITDPATAKALVDKAKRFPYFWIDDVLITGILARTLRLEHVDLKRIFLIEPRFTFCCASDMETYSVGCDHLIGPNGGDNNLFYKFNLAVEKCLKKGCGKRLVPLNETCNFKLNDVSNVGSPVIEDFRLF